MWVRGKTLPDIPTKYCGIGARLTFASGRETENDLGFLAGRTRALLACHLISFGYFQPREGEEGKR